LGNKPEGMAADPVSGLVAVGLTDPDLLALVDGDSGRVVRRVDLPESPRHLQLAEPGGPVLVPAERGNALSEVSLPDGEIRSTKVGKFPHDATAAGGRILVANEFGNTVSVVEDGRVVRTLPAPLQPGGVVGAAGGSLAGLIAVRERVLELYDARSLRSLGRLPAGVGPTHLVSDGGNLLFVIDTQGNALLLYRLRPKLELNRRVFLPGTPYGVAIDQRRKRLWVTLTERNEVVELTATGGPRPLRSFPTVRQPNTVAVNPDTGRVFIASRADGTLQILDPPEEP